MDHMDLISDRAAPSPDSKGARAISALDSLVQELAAPEQVRTYTPDTAATLKIFVYTCCVPSVGIVVTVMQLLLVWPGALLPSCLDNFISESAEHCHFMCLQYPKVSALHKKV